MKLNISDSLSLPLNAVTQKLAFLGSTGSGKSYAATKLAEEMHAAGAQIVVFDPVGIWKGLRSSANGRGPGIPIPIFGGLQADVPLEQTGGALIADLLVDKTLSCIIDLSQFEHDTHKARFAADFGKRFFFRKKSSPSALHLFLEEAEEFLPQEPTRGEEQMIHEFKRIWKLGRNFGIGGSLISQRPQELVKKALNLTECLFAFKMTGPHERKAVDGWISEKGLDQDIAGDLPKLQVGHCHIWSPSWLQVSKVIQIAPKWTLDASSTPVVGASGRKAAKLAEIDLKEISGQMAATIERAKAEDPKHLRSRIQELEAELKKKAGAAVVPPPVLKTPPAVLSALKNIRVFSSGLAKKALAASDLLEALSTDAYALTESIGACHEEAGKGGTVENKVTPPAALVHVGPTLSLPIIKRSAPVDGEKLSRAQLQILQSLYWLKDETKEPAKVAFYANYTVNGHFNNTLGSLRGLGLVTGWQITNAGELRLAQETDAKPKPRGSELRQWMGAKLSGIENKMLDALIEAGQGARLTNEELASRIGSTVNGHFNNSLGHIRSICVVEGYAKDGGIKAADVFFD